MRPGVVFELRRGAVVGGVR